MSTKAHFGPGQVYFLTCTIPNAVSRIRVWERIITSAGGSVSKVQFCTWTASSLFSGWRDMQHWNIPADPAVGIVLFHLTCLQCAALLRDERMPL